VWPARKRKKRKFNVLLVEPTPISYIFTLIESESDSHEILSFPRGKGRLYKKKVLFVMSEFAPILIYLGFSLLVSLILVGLPFLFSSNSSTYPEKLSAYEIIFLRGIFIVGLLFVSYFIFAFFKWDYSILHSFWARAFMASLIKTIFPFAALGLLLVTPFIFISSMETFLYFLPGEAPPQPEAPPVQEELNLQNLSEMGQITNRLGRLTQVYANEIDILTNGNLVEEIDDRLLLAQQRGQAPFIACSNCIKQELDCIELEGLLKKKMYSLLSTEPERENFFYSTPADLLDSVKIVIDTGNCHFQQNRTLEENEQLSNRLSDNFIMLEGPAGRESPLYTEVRDLARTGG